jgi:TetR/AcrR family transcriptional regulator, tetracycline repressor protein
MSARTARRTKGKLDPEVVIEAALRLADAEGLDAISVRRLAEQFQVTPMALYWHFDDKEALLAGVADRLWVETAETLDRSLEQLSGAQDDGWGQLRLVLNALITVMQRHPAAAELVPSRVLSCEAGRGVTELTLGFLSDQGFEPAYAADLAVFLLSSAVMLVSTQAGIGIPDPQERAEHQRLKRIALASLPLDRYPHIAASAGYLTDCETPEVYVARGCEAIIAGVRALAPS